MTLKIFSTFSALFTFSLLVFGLVQACTAAQTAEGWAKSACRVVEALPIAPSGVPSGQEMHLVISSTSASACLRPSPDAGQQTD